MPESFRRIYQQFVEPGTPHYVRQSFRLVPDLDAPISDIRGANFAKWREMGFDQLETDHLGVVMYEDDEYAIISQVKNATDTDYDIMFICLPKDNQPIQHLPCFLPQRVVEAFYLSVNRGTEVLRQLALQNGDSLRRIYVHHHVGPFELNSYSYNISFPQLHMHVMAVTDRDLAASSVGVSRAELQRTGNLHTYTDPSVLVAKDIYEHQFQKSAAIDFATSSLILDNRPIDYQITPDERQLLPEFYAQWHKWWAMLAMCFSNLELDEYQRLEVAKSKAERQVALQVFLQHFPIFSDQSLQILDFLVNHCHSFNPQQPEKATYAGIAGAIGWVHNFDTQTTELRFGPRLLTSSKKMGASDGFYVGIKDKSRYYPQAEERLAIQRQIFTALQASVAAQPICP